jgi:hypothetical protein
MMLSVTQITVESNLAEKALHVLGATGVFSLVSVSMIVHIIFSVAVFKDAKKIALPNSGKTLAVFSPLQWALFCYFSSVAGVAIYLCTHYSTFRKES